MYELTTNFMNLSLIEAGLSGFGGNSQIHVQNELSHILIQFTTCLPNAIPLHYCYTIHIIHNYEWTSFYLSHCCTQPHDYRKELGVIISLDMRRQLFQYFSLQKKMLYLGVNPLLYSMINRKNVWFLGIIANNWLCELAKSNNNDVKTKNYCTDVASIWAKQSKTVMIAWWFC